MEEQAIFKQHNLEYNTSMKQFVLTFLFITFSITAKPITITFLGDSLTAGYQLKESAAFPQQFENIVSSENIRILNRGVSGDTTYSLLNRLEFSLQPTPDVVFLAIGANDGLRGMPIDSMKENINLIIKHCKNNQIDVILAGITLPDNYSEDYISDFENTFNEIAKKEAIPFMPFLLKDVAAIPTLNLTDGIHPNKLGHQIIAQNIVLFLKQKGLVSSQNKWVNATNKVK